MFRVCTFSSPAINLLHVVLFSCGKSIRPAFCAAKATNLCCFVFSFTLSGPIFHLYQPYFVSKLLPGHNRAGSDRFLSQKQWGDFVPPHPPTLRGVLLEKEPKVRRSYVAKLSSNSLSLRDEFESSLATYSLVRSKNKNRFVPHLSLFFSGLRLSKLLVSTKVRSSPWIDPRNAFQVSDSSVGGGGLSTTFPDSTTSVSSHRSSFVASLLTLRSSSFPRLLNPVKLSTVSHQ